MESDASGLGRSLAIFLLLSSVLVACNRDSYASMLNPGGEMSATEGSILIAGIGFLDDTQFGAGDIEDQDNGYSTLRIVPLIDPEGVIVLLARERGPDVDLEDHTAAVAHLAYIRCGEWATRGLLRHWREKPPRLGASWR